LDDSTIPKTVLLPENFDLFPGDVVITPEYAIPGYHDGFFRARRVDYHWKNESVALSVGIKKLRPWIQPCELRHWLSFSYSFQEWIAPQQEGEFFCFFIDSVLSGETFSWEKHQSQLRGWPTLTKWESLPQIDRIWYWVFGDRAAKWFPDWISKRNRIIIDVPQNFKAAAVGSVFAHNSTLSVATIASWIGGEAGLKIQAATAAHRAWVNTQFQMTVNDSASLAGVCSGTYDEQLNPYAKTTGRGCCGFLYSRGYD
jgi:hypothetical protein